METHQPLTLRDRLAGSLLGTAIGDALGLPYEGLSRRHAGRLYGPPDRYRLLFGRGMVSDDTEHACLVAQALVASAGDVDAFERQLARRLKRWLLTLPAGLGRATLFSTVRLCCGMSPRRSGVFSAGNGPAMRAPLLGVAVTDAGRLKQLVQVSTRMTHTDPRAEQGALAVAWAARRAAEGSRPDAAAFVEEVTSNIPLHDGELLHALEQVAASVQSGESTVEFAARIADPQGVSGYINHTAPVVLHAWLRNPRDVRAAVTAVIECGGDTDTTAAIVGGIVGAAVGPDGIPREWRERLLEWPRSVEWMQRLAGQLAEVIESGAPQQALDLCYALLLARNLAFLTVLLAHGVRRLAPPY